MRYCPLILALALSANACQPETQVQVETGLDQVDSASRAGLEDSVKAVVQAQAYVEYICEAAPSSPYCTTLTGAINKFYAIAVFVQDSLDNGQDVRTEVAGLVRLADALRSHAEAVYRSIV